MPQVKNVWLFIISLGLGVFVLAVVVERLVFLARADRTTGQVVELTSQNSRCGGKSKHDCTRFYADVEFAVRGNTYRVHVPAGNSRGHDLPLTYAQYEIGSSVPVVYSRRNPMKAYRDAFYDIWGTPVMWFFGQIATLLGAFSERKKTA